jgi:hypothetical protein
MYELHFYSCLLETRLCLRHQSCALFSYLRGVDPPPHAIIVSGFDRSQLASPGHVHCMSFVLDYGTRRSHSGVYSVPAHSATLKAYAL